MKSSTLLAAALAAAAAGLAQAAPEPAVPPSGARPAPAYDPNEMVCRRVQEIGSRLRAARMCLTRAQWAQQVREDRQNAEHAQSQRNPRAY
jgi:Spy/CpxP family protein refolding chaperone